MLLYIKLWPSIYSSTQPSATVVQMHIYHSGFTTHWSF